MRYIDNRHRTRDLLLEYDVHFIPGRPRAGGTSMIFPYETRNFAQMKDELYRFAADSGFTGTQAEFNTGFGAYLENSRKEIVFGYYVDFPAQGNSQTLYFDLDEKILYYWENEYIPVNTLPIANTILNGGDA